MSSNPWSNFCDLHWELISCNKWHSGRDLRNTHTTGNSCRDTPPCTNMALKLHLLCSFGLLAMLGSLMQPEKNLFLYLEGDRLGLKKPEEKDYCYYIIFLARFRCWSSSKFLLPNRTCIDMKQGQQFIFVRYFNVVRAFPQCHSI